MASPPDLPERLLVAVGGNATHPPEIRGTAEEQAAIAAATGRALLPLLQLENELIITHGNGPVVGKILMRQAISSEQVTPMTLDICVAHSQGESPTCSCRRSRTRSGARATRATWSAS